MSGKDGHDSLFLRFCVSFLRSEIIA